MGPPVEVRILHPEPISKACIGMKLDKERQLFFGCKIDSKLRESLAMAKPGDRKYFEDPAAGFLQIIDMPRPDRERDDRYIGKIVKCGMGCGDIEDLQRNVVSILRRIAPDIRTNPTSIKIFVIDESEPEAAVEEPAEQKPASGGGGPYIDY